jgi:hypothetical protein
MKKLLTIFGLSFLMFAPVMEANKQVRFADEQEVVTIPARGQTEESIESKKEHKALVILKKYVVPIVAVLACCFLGYRLLKRKTAPSAPAAPTPQPYKPDSSIYNTNDGNRLIRIEWHAPKSADAFDAQVKAEDPGNIMFVESFMYPEDITPAAVERLAAQGVHQISIAPTLARGNGASSIRVYANRSNANQTRYTIMLPPGVARTCPALHQVFRQIEPNINLH